MILTEFVRSASDLAYNGDFQAAIAVLDGKWKGVGVEPVRNGESDGEFAALLLACGMLSVEMGRFNLAPVQADAKDLLTKAARLFGDDPAREEARLWLALSYLWCGENNEALAIVDSILSDQIAESGIVFSAGRIRGLCYLYLGNYEQSEASLKAVEVLIDTVSPLSRGKFYLNRGMLFRRTERLDEALDDYCAAAVACREAGSLRYEAAAENNRAGIFSDQGRLDEAIGAATCAVKLFRDLGDRAHEAKALDQLARAWERAGRFDKMECAARSAVALLTESDHEGWLAEALTTHGVACARLGLAKAVSELERALSICERQGDPVQAETIAAAMWDLVRRGHEARNEMRSLITTAERTVYAHVLDKHNGHVSPAAHDLGIHHKSLSKRLATRFPDLLPKRVPPQRRRAKTAFLK